MGDETGVSDVTAAGVREAVVCRMIQTDWAAQGLEPRRSTVTTRASTSEGRFIEVLLPAEPEVTLG